MNCCLTHYNTWKSFKQTSFAARVSASANICTLSKRWNGSLVSCVGYLCHFFDILALLYQKTCP
jgi:hypothetical protein